MSGLAQPTKVICVLAGQYVERLAAFARGRYGTPHGRWLDAPRRVASSADQGPALLGIWRVLGALPPIEPVDAFHGAVAHCLMSMAKPGVTPLHSSRTIGEHEEA